MEGRGVKSGAVGGAWIPGGRSQDPQRAGPGLPKSGDRRGSSWIAKDRQGSFRIDEDRSGSFRIVQDRSGSSGMLKNVEEGSIRGNADGETEEMRKRNEMNRNVYRCGADGLRAAESVGGRRRKRGARVRHGARVPHWTAAPERAETRPEASEAAPEAWACLPADAIPPQFANGPPGAAGAVRMSQHWATRFLTLPAFHPDAPPHRL